MLRCRTSPHMFVPGILMLADQPTISPASFLRLKMRIVGSALFTGISQNRGGEVTLTAIRDCVPVHLRDLHCHAHILPLDAKLSR